MRRLRDMRTFVLLPGAGGAASYWDRVVPLLRDAGHETIAVGLPGRDVSAGLERYAQLTVDAAQPCSRVTLVAQSLGGFTAAMAAVRLPLEQLVFVNAMIPLPGETPGQWWGATRAVEAREAAARIGGYGSFEVETYFLHDLDVSGMPDDPQEEAETVFSSRCTFTALPEVPIRVLAGADDRFFPVEFQRRVATERLGIPADVRPGGHLIALAQPQVVAEYLLGE
jgi:pimeloyl-ACP methyl ester carboxylesterase